LNICKKEKNGGKPKTEMDLVDEEVKDGRRKKRERQKNFIKNIASSPVGRSRRPINKIFT
jgi:hypothetical protein